MLLIGIHPLDICFIMLVMCAAQFDQIGLVGNSVPVNLKKCVCVKILRPIKLNPKGSQVEPLGISTPHSR